MMGAGVNLGHVPKRSRDLIIPAHEIKGYLEWVARREASSVGSNSR